MAARQEVTLIVSARDKTRAVFRRIGRGLRRFRVGLGSLVAGGAFAAMAKSALNAATEIEGASKRLGIAGEELQGLKIIGQGLNIQFASIATVLQRLKTNAADATTGNTRLYEAFRKLTGLRTSELAQLDGLQILERIADTASVRNWNDIAALIRQVGDTEAVGLRGLLEQGSPALRRQIERLRAEGKLLDDQSRQRLAEEEQRGREAFVKAQTEFAQLMVELLPALNESLRGLNETVRAIRSLDEDAPVVGRQLLRDAGDLSQGEAFNLAPGVLPARLLAGYLSKIADASTVTAKNTADAGRLR